MRLSYEIQSALRKTFVLCRQSLATRDLLLALCPEPPDCSRAQLLRHKQGICVRNLVAEVTLLMTSPATRSSPGTLSPIEAQLYKLTQVGTPDIYQRLDNGDIEAWTWIRALNSSLDRDFHDVG